MEAELPAAVPPKSGDARDDASDTTRAQRGGCGRKQMLDELVDPIREAAEGDATRTAGRGLGAELLPSGVEPGEPGER